MDGSILQEALVRRQTRARRQRHPGVGLPRVRPRLHRENGRAAGALEATAVDVARVRRRHARGCLARGVRELCSVSLPTEPPSAASTISRPGSPCHSAPFREAFPRHRLCDGGATQISCAYARAWGPCRQKPHHVQQIRGMPRNRYTLILPRRSTIHSPIRYLDRSPV